jgi:hypothetical protein
MHNSIYESNSEHKDSQHFDTQQNGIKQKDTQHSDTVSLRKWQY